MDEGTVLNVYYHYIQCLEGRFMEGGGRVPKVAYGHKVRPLVKPRSSLQ